VTKKERSLSPKKPKEHEKESRIKHISSLPPRKGNHEGKRIAARGDRVVKTLGNTGALGGAPKKNDINQFAQRKGRKKGRSNSGVGQKPNPVEKKRGGSATQTKNPETGLRPSEEEGETPSEPTRRSHKEITRELNSVSR